MGPWPDGGVLADGGWIRDARGNLHERRVSVAACLWRIEDRLAGPFASAVLRWRLDPALDWRATSDGAQATGVTLAIAGAAAVTLEQGWISRVYGQVTPAPVLTARLPAGTAQVTTFINLWLYI
jgi:hypothetical protein